jgi:hypothetical protein
MQAKRHMAHEELHLGKPLLWPLAHSLERPIVKPPIDMANMQRIIFPIHDSAQRTARCFRRMDKDKSTILPRQRNTLLSELGLLNAVVRRGPVIAHTGIHILPHNRDIDGATR